jgi:putative component of toxin-antitoxin plasmid stabilization module
VTPPLHDVVAPVFEHPRFEPPAEADVRAYVRVKSATLRDVATALASKPVGPHGDKRLVYELKFTGPRGALRIYYTIASGAVFVLRAGGKAGQSDDIARACKLAVAVKLAPQQYAVPERRIA